MKLDTQGTADDRGTVERSRGWPLFDGRFRFGEVEGARNSQVGPGFDCWPGRYWLPADSQVQPTGKSCLTRAFGRAGEASRMISNAAPITEGRAIPDQLPFRALNATLAP
jgi:hypothetical protein